MLPLSNEVARLRPFGVSVKRGDKSAVGIAECGTMGSSELMEVGLQE
jgi:hypothetical protein